MATIAQIISVKWPNAKWSIHEDDYSTLRWQSREIPKPAESEIRAYSNEIDAEREKGRKAKAREQKVLRKQGDLIETIEILAVTLANLASSIAPSVLTTPVNLTDINALVQRLDSAKDPGNGDGTGGGSANNGNNGGGNNPNNPGEGNNSNKPKV